MALLCKTVPVFQFHWEKESLFDIHETRLGSYGIAKETELFYST